MCQHGVTAGEIALVPVHKSLDPGVIQGVFRAEIRAPSMIALFNPHDVQRIGPEIGEAELRAVCKQRLVERRQVVAGEMQFPAKLADIGHAHRGDGLSGDGDLPHAHPGHRLLRKIRVGQAGQERP